MPLDEKEIEALGKLRKCIDKLEKQKEITIENIHRINNEMLDLEIRIENNHSNLKKAAVAVAIGIITIGSLLCTIKYILS